MKVIFLKHFIAKFGTEFFESSGYFCLLFGFESIFLLGFDGHVMILENRFGDSNRETGINERLD